MTRVKIYMDLSQAVEDDADRGLEEAEKSEKRKAKRDSSTAPANFFVGTKKEEKISRLRSE